MISSMLETHLQYLLLRMRALRPAQERIAAFDLDNTLIAGDIGEAVLAQLLLDKFPLGITYRQYLELRERDKAEAFRAAVRAMEGLSETEIRTATRTVLRSSLHVLEVEGIEVPVPYPNQEMVEVVRWLRENEFAIHIFSASNHVSVGETVHQWFSLDPQRAHGVSAEITDGICTGTIIEPAPIGEGKVLVYRAAVGQTAPMITGGDSEGDVPLLSLTDREGLVLWVSEQTALSGTVRKHPAFSHRVVGIQRPIPLALEEETSHIG